MTYRWVTIASASTGNVITTAAAIKPPQSICSYEIKL